jgi:hypothetical protein
MTSIGMKLHAGQKKVYSSNNRFKVVVAGRRWGKTRTAKASIIKICALPNRLIWYVAPTYRMARGIMWQELIDTIPKKWIVKVNETMLMIRLRNGTRIELKGADKPDTLRGVGLNHVVLDEAQDMKSETWFRILRPTLASTDGTALIIGTPKAFNWLYDVYKLGQRGIYYQNDRGDRRLNPWRSWQFPTITSPFIPDKEIEDARNSMDEKSFRQEFEASFETMSGRVYYAFDRNEHVGDYKFNPSLPIWIGQDFNIDPMSSVIMQPQPNGEVWIVGEMILFSSNTQETADELQKKFHKQMKQIIIYPDPAGANGGTRGRGESDLDILREAGFNSIVYHRKHPPVSDRVNSVNRMFKAADGMVRMRVDRSCVETIKALEQTIYKPNSREVDKSAGHEHPADALGYCIQHRFPVRDIKILGLSI